MCVGIMSGHLYFNIQADSAIEQGSDACTARPMHVRTCVIHGPAHLFLLFFSIYVTALAAINSTTESLIHPSCRQRGCNWPAFLSRTIVQARARTAHVWPASSRLCCYLPSLCSVFSSSASVCFSCVLYTHACAYSTSAIFPLFIRPSAHLLLAEILGFRFAPLFALSFNEGHSQLCGRLCQFCLNLPQNWSC